MRELTGNPYTKFLVFGTRPDGSADVYSNTSPREQMALADLINKRAIRDIPVEVTARFKDSPEHGATGK